MYSALHDRAPAAPGSCSATSPGPRMRPSGREAWTRVPASPRLVPRWGRRTRAGRPGKSVSAPPGPGSIYRLPAAAQWASRAAHSGSLRSPAEGRHVPTDAPNPQPRGASAADWEAAAAWKPRAPSCFLPWPGRGGWRQVWSPPRPPGWAARGASAHPPPSAPRPELRGTLCSLHGRKTEAVSRQSHAGGADCRVPARLLLARGSSLLDEHENPGDSC